MRDTMSDKRSGRDNPTDLRKTPNVTLATRRSDRRDLRRDPDWSRTDIQFGGPMLESVRDLGGLNPRGTLGVHSKNKSQKDQRVNCQGEVRNKAYHLRGG